MTDRHATLRNLDAQERKLVGHLERDWDEFHVLELIDTGDQSSLPSACSPRKDGL
jgi:hypothetical protein